MSGPRARRARAVRRSPSWPSARSRCSWGAPSRAVAARVSSARRRRAPSRAGATSCSSLRPRRRGSRPRRTALRRAQRPRARRRASTSCSSSTSRAACAARDVPPSRLERARALGDAVLAGLAMGDRAALAAFAGRGVLLTPLTPDTDALRALLPALDDVADRRGRLAPRGGRARRARRLPPGRHAAPGAAPPLRRRGSRHGARTRRGRASRRPAPDRRGRASGARPGAPVPLRNAPLRDARGAPGRDAAPTRRACAGLAEPTDGALLRRRPFGAVDPAAVVAAVRRDAGAAARSFVERRVPRSAAGPSPALALAALLAEPCARRRLRAGSGALLAPARPRAPPLSRPPPPSPLRSSAAQPPPRRTAMP